MSTLRTTAFAILLCGLSALATTASVDFTHKYEKNGKSYYQGKNVTFAVKDFNLNGLKCDQSSAHFYNVPHFQGSRAIIECTLSVDATVTGKQTVLTYMTRRGNWLILSINQQSELVWSFRRSVDDKSVADSCNSQRIQFVPGKPTKIRIEAESGKDVRFFIDGRIVHKLSGKGRAFSDMAEPVRYYPRLVIGSTFWADKYLDHFKGTIQNIMISDGQTESGATVPTAAVTTAKVHQVLQKVTAVPDCNAMLAQDFAKELTWSTPFKAHRIKSKTVNELYLDIDAKYKNCAATAAIFHDGQRIGAIVRCPFPKGATMKQEKTVEAWRNDHIEWFLQCGTGNTDIWQFLVDVNGHADVYHYPASKGHSQMQIPSDVIQSVCAVGETGFTVAMSLPISLLGTPAMYDGAVWHTQFIRSGSSAGGHWSWSPTDVPFMQPATFGDLILHSRKAYWTERLSQIAAQTKIESKAITEKRRELDAAIQKNGDDEAQWTHLENNMLAFYNTVLSEIHAGRRLFFWTTDRYDNFSPDVAVPLVAKEIMEIAQVSPAGARTEDGFVISNLTTRDMMLNVRFSGNSELAKAIRLREVGFIEHKSGAKAPDPLFDIPAGSIIRVPANTSSLIWINVDCAKLAPGKYQANLNFFPSYSGFEAKDIPVNVEVLPIDIRTIDSPAFPYTLTKEYLIPALKEYPFNGIIITNNYYPREVDGIMQSPRLDHIIETFQKNGIPKSQIRLWFHLMYPIWGSIRLPGGKLLKPPTDEWKVEFKKQLCSLRDYLAQKHQIGYGQFFFMIRDEPNGDPDDPKTTAFTTFQCAQIIKEIDPNLRVAANPYLFVNGEKEKRYTQMFDVLIPGSALFTGNQSDLRQNYLDSGKTLWHYSVFSKTIPPYRYRYLAWISINFNLDGPGMFYSLVTMSGDGYNSYDSMNGKSRETIDYGAAYPDEIREVAVPSRRLEAWYQGVIDFRLAKFCREKLKAHPDAALQKEFDSIATEAMSANTAEAFDASREKLLNLASRLRQVRE